MFNARDWYWHVGGDETKAYSSKSNTYVDPASDADYAAWAQINVQPTPIGSEAEIWFYVAAFLPAWLWNGTTMSQLTATTYSKAQLTGYTADARWRKEQGGLTLASGMPIITDDRAQAKINGARIAALATKWYAADGMFYDLTSAQVIAMSDELQAHINNCFVIAADVQAQITAGAITTCEQVDAAFA